MKDKETTTLYLTQTDQASEDMKIDTNEEGNNDSLEQITSNNKHCHSRDNEGAVKQYGDTESMDDRNVIWI